MSDQERDVIERYRADLNAARFSERAWRKKAQDKSDEADARLISLASEMAEELKALLWDIRRDNAEGVWDGHIGTIRDLLARARIVPVPASPS